MDIYIYVHVQRMYVPLVYTYFLNMVVSSGVLEYAISCLVVSYFSDDSTKMLLASWVTPTAACWLHIICATPIEGWRCQKLHHHLPGCVRLLVKPH